MPQVGGQLPWGFKSKLPHHALKLFFLIKPHIHPVENYNLHFRNIFIEDYRIHITWTEGDESYKCMIFSKLG
jgi:hypothetical protein